MKYLPSFKYYMYYVTRSSLIMPENEANFSHS